MNGADACDVCVVVWGGERVNSACVYDYDPFPVSLSACACTSFFRSKKRRSRKEKDQEERSGVTEEGRLHKRWLDHETITKEAIATPTDREKATKREVGS